MNDNKKFENETDSAENLPVAYENSTRARNKTVMLSAEMTGSMRSRMADGIDGLLGESKVEPFSTSVRDDSDWDETPSKMFGEPQLSIGIEAESKSAEADTSVASPHSESTPDWNWQSNDSVDSLDEPDSVVSLIEENNQNLDRAESYTAADSMSWTPASSIQVSERAVGNENQIEPSHAPRIVRLAVEAQVKSDPDRNLETYDSHSVHHSANGYVVTAPTFSNDEPKIEIKRDLTKLLSDPKRGEPMPQQNIVEQRAVAPHENFDTPEQIVWKSETPLCGFLVTFDHNPLGSYLELRAGRMIITSQFEGSGNCLVLNDPSVSPMHAIMRVTQSGPIQLLDQLSENGTRVIRAESGEEDLLSGDKTQVMHGDMIWFGDRKFHLCLIQGIGQLLE